MKNLALLLLVLLCTCARAQTIIDTTYNIAYPYTKKILSIGSKGGVFVDFLQLQEDDKEKQRYCKVKTEPIGTSSAYSILLNKEQSVLLTEKLNDLYVWSGVENPNTYTERVDIMLGLAGRLEISMFAENKDARFILQLDADRWLDRGKVQVGRQSIPPLITMVRECIDML